MEVEDICVDDVADCDYPDFSNAYAIQAFEVLPQGRRRLTEEELDFITEEHSDLINELAHEAFLDR